ncbi:MAG TPA: DUF433 domain-containing protein [Thermoanaerobaculia bacterium]|nr:DUF433 domain-containing protein [Thermoanaerobaculia bacterium]
MGRHVSRAPRIPVSVVLDNLAAGIAEGGIIGSYPRLTPEAIRRSCVSGQRHHQR